MMLLAFDLGVALVRKVLRHMPNRIFGVCGHIVNLYNGIFFLKFRRCDRHAGLIGIQESLRAIAHGCRRKDRIGRIVCRILTDHFIRNRLFIR